MADTSPAGGSASTTSAGSSDQAASGRGFFRAIAEKLPDPRSATPYVGAALLTALAMGWYFYVFVPQKLEYFVGLRFRTLAVASGQIKGKAESLGLALNIAPAPLEDTSAAATNASAATPKRPETKKSETPKEADTEKYLRLLVPEIRLAAPEAPERPGLKLVSHPADAQTKSLTATVAWDRVASQGAAASLAEFDDLVLAAADGHVLWQREKTTPRLGKLTELLYAPEDQGTLMSPSWAIRTIFPAADEKKALPSTAALKRVRIGATSTYLLVQAVRLSSPYITDENQTTLYVAGLISRQRLEQQAMRIPLVWVVFVSLPIAVLFLALPFIKLATMNSKERFSVVNLILMAIGTVAAVGLAAVVPMGPRSVTDAGDAELARLATLVDMRIEDETTRVLTLAQSIVTLGDGTSELGSCEGPVESRMDPKPCDLWVALKTELRGHLPELDVAVWLDDRGLQVRKWTTKAQLTRSTPHTAFEHYRNLTSGNLWALVGGTIGFTIEPLRSPTTAELGVVYAMPLRDLRQGDDARAASTQTTAIEPRYLALNVRPHAIVDPVMPPGYGFAIVAPDGRVLFHSTDGLSLEENFLEEVSSAQSVRERMQLDRAITWSGDYHGTPHRLHMRPISTLRGSRWKVVTFQDLNPALAAIVEHQSGTFRLSLLNLLSLVMGAGLFGWIYTWRHGGDIRDLMTAPRSPDPVVLRGLLVLVAVAILALVATCLEGAHYGSDRLLVSFFVLPFLAAAISVCARTQSGKPEPSRIVDLEIALLVILVGVVPAAGFSRVVQRVQNVQSTEQWLAAAHQRTVAHADGFNARAAGPGYRGSKARTAVQRVFVTGADAELPHFYVAGSPGWAATDATAQCDRSPELGQHLVRAILDWTMFPADRRGGADVRACPSSNLMQVTGKGVMLAANVWPASAWQQPSLRALVYAALRVAWQRWAVGIAIFTGIVLAAYWAWGRLRTPSAFGGTTFAQALEFIEDDVNQGIMLIGPPRTRKDQWIHQAVTEHLRLKKLPGSEGSIYRIKLLDAKIDETFVKDKFDDISARSHPDTGKPSCLASKTRLWIHVSNLESQLTTEQDRKAVLALLEKLLDRAEGEPSRIIIVTTSVDPIAHFHEIFTTERQAIQDDDIPEVQLSRSSLILSRFRRCYLPIAAQEDDPWWNYKPERWPTTLDWEAAGYPPLVEVAAALKKTCTEKKIEPSASGGGPPVTRIVPREAIPRDELARVFRTQALATYDLLWASCTRCEKIVLIQLAQEGFLTTRNCEVVWGLIHKGLIVERPRPTIFNNSFRSFLRHIERDHVVEQWERADGNGLWLVAGRLIGTSLIVGGLFYLTTQDFSVDSLLPVVSGTGVFGAPAVRALLERVTSRGGAALVG